MPAGGCSEQAVGGRVMKCRNCGKSGLRNLQALRAHLRWCPERQTNSNPSHEMGQKPRTTRPPRSSVRPYPREQNHFIPLADMPGAEELEEVGLSIGVPPKAARVTANYLSYITNLEDPLGMWREMQCCPEVAPRLRRMWLRTWCSTRGIPLAPWQIIAMGWEE